MPISPSQVRPFDGEPPLIIGRNRDTLNAMAASCGEFDGMKSSLVSVIKRGDYLDTGGSNISTYKVDAIVADPNPLIQWRYSLSHVGGQDFGPLTNLPVRFNAVKPFEASPLPVGRIVAVVDLADEGERDANPQILDVEPNVPGACPTSGGSGSAKRGATGGTSGFQGMSPDKTLAWLATKAASPAGSNTQVQFNDGGALAGDAGLTWDKTNNRLNVNESGFVGPNIAVRGSGSSYAALYAQTSAGISSFSVGEDGSGHAFILFGDADDADNKIKFILVGTTMSFQVPGGLAVLGDYDGFGNGTLLQIDDANQVVTSNVPVEVPDDAYGSGWNGSVEVPTKNAMYDKIESLSGGSGLTHPQVLARGLGA